MSDSHVTVLTEAEIAEIKEQALAKIGVCKKQNDIIGQQVFLILGCYARVIYYPLGVNSVWGFTRIAGACDERTGDKPFVVINSSISLDCQVFAAAHELYHIWFDEEAEIVSASIMDESNANRNELKANRFAAEFLVDSDLLFKGISMLSISEKNISMKDILYLSELFCVPYRTMVKRLFETKIFTKKEMEDFLLKTDEEVSVARKRFAILEPQADDRIAIDTLNDLAMEAYEKHLISFERLEYLLSLSNLTPTDIGIVELSTNELPSDDELAKIMEGE